MVSHSQGIDAAALQRAEALCRAVLAELPGAGAAVLDRDLKLTLAESPTSHPTALRTEAHAGLELAQIMRPEVYAQVRPHYDAALAGEESRMTIEGGRGSIRVTLQPIYDGDGVAGVLAVWVDDTESRATSAELLRRLAQQNAVTRLGQLALTEAGDEELMQAACDAVAETLDVELVSLQEHLGEGMMHVRAGRGWEPGYVGSLHDMKSFRTEEGRARYAAGPWVIEDLPDDTSLRARPLRAHGVVAGVSVIVGGNPASPLGLLGAFARGPLTFSRQDLDFLQAVAHVVARSVEQRRTEERIRHDALHDPLTGLPNRTLLHDRLSSALARAGRSGRMLAVLCVDVDHLKLVNDSLGHHAGDDLLRALAPRLVSELRPGDTVGRFSGDGFIAICDDVADEPTALAIAQRLLACFAEPFTLPGGTRHATASVGVVLAQAGAGRGPADLIADAEAAMYRAKERGRARVEVSDPKSRERRIARLRLEEDLRRALETEGELSVAYQPIHRLSDGSLAGLEALVRWQHPERGPISPGEFIPVAEESGLIVPLGAWVLRTACGQMAEWDVPGLTLSVNVSVRQVANDGLVEAVEDALIDSRLKPSALGLEITEGLLLEHNDATRETLAALKQLGVRLLLDDFGTGFSSLGYLRRYDLDILKIDRSFVADLGEDGRGDAAIVEAIVGMARALGMWTVPEGVETPEQLARLAELGCDFAQGFHLGRPQGVAETGALLRGLASSR
jgi:diguanylate cyclase (GGDEF)-like protein